MIILPFSPKKVCVFLGVSDSLNSVEFETLGTSATSTCLDISPSRTLPGTRGRLELRSFSNLDAGTSHSLLRGRGLAQDQVHAAWNGQDISLHCELQIQGHDDFAGSCGKNAILLLLSAPGTGSASSGQLSESSSPGHRRCRGFPLDLQKAQN